MARRRTKGSPDPRISADPLLTKFSDERPRKGDLRRLEIIRGAIDYVASHGLDTFSLDALAGTMKLARSHVIYYFPNQRLLLLSAARYCILSLQEFTVQEVSGRTDRKLLAGVTVAACRWAIRHPEQASMLFASYHLGSCDPEVRNLLTEFREIGYRRVVAAVERVSGQTGPKVEPVAKQIHGLITGYLVEIVTSRQALSASAYGELALDAATQWIRKIS